MGGGGEEVKSQPSTFRLRIWGLYCVVRSAMRSTGSPLSVSKLSKTTESAPRLCGCAKVSYPCALPLIQELREEGKRDRRAFRDARRSDSSVGGGSLVAEEGLISTRKILSYLPPSRLCFRVDIPYMDSL